MITKNIYEMHLFFTIIIVKLIKMNFSYLKSLKKLIFYFSKLIKGFNLILSH